MPQEKRYLMQTLRDKAWIWGYMINGAVPGNVPFAPNDRSACSLETAADYMDVPNVIFMNSNHDMKTLTPEYLKPLANCKQIVCGLQHGAYAETAKKVSQLSKIYPNIKGGLIDDFLDYHGPSKSMTVEETRAVYEALKSENPDLRLAVVQYTWQDPAQDQAILRPYLPYIDIINLWTWVPDPYEWNAKLNNYIEQMTARTGKPVLLGLYLHDFGGTGGPMPMDMLELQMKKAMGWAKCGRIEGFVMIHSGYFDDENHRPQIQWTKEYLNWAFKTYSSR